MLCGKSINMVNKCRFENSVKSNKEVSQKVSQFRKSKYNINKTNIHIDDVYQSFEEN
jgi:hypothetical protein